jgi:XTP/dITP diphosphohydrolase
MFCSEVGRLPPFARHLSLFFMKLYLASANPGKLREFRQAAAARSILVEAVPGFDELPPCVEDGKTFEENARKKALYYAACVEGLVFADDSGICVDALDGAPGVYSARFAGPDADDKANNAKLLEELRRVGREAAEKSPSESVAPNRSAHYICVIALAQRGRILTVVEGRADGVISESPHGTGGFGYDPYFYFPPLGKTFAELAPEDKFAVSHRGEAFRKLLDSLTVSNR